MAGHDAGDLGRFAPRQPILLEHVRDFGLGLAGPRLDLLAFARDLGLEDLPLALAGQVLAGGHAEHAGEPRGDAGHEDHEACRPSRRPPCWPRPRC